MSMPRSEYPRPQFVREDWLCLNGQWQFEIDLSDTGKERGLIDKPLAREITVPFCPESELSGVGETDFLNAVWYRREIEIPAEWKDRRALLHFQLAPFVGQGMLHLQQHMTKCFLRDAFHRPEDGHDILLGVGLRIPVTRVEGVDNGLRTD